MIARVVALGLGLLTGVGQAIAGCADNTVEIRSGGSQVQFHVEVVDTAQSRAQGLMHRSHLPRFSGMLFVYQKPQSVSFWMRNTLIPLDLIFMDKTGTVQRVHADAKPLDETAIPGGDEILLVLEINGGMASALGIEPGGQMRHPSLDQSIAAWRCIDG